MFLTSKELNYILKSLGRYRNKLLLFFLLGIPAGLVKAAQAYLVKPLFSEGFFSDSSDKLNEIIIALILISIGNYFFRYISGYGIGSSVIKISQEMTRKVIAKYMSADSLSLQTQEKGSLLNIILFDVPVYANISKELFSLIKEFITIISLVGVLLYQSVELSFFILILIPFYGVLISYLNKKSKSNGAKVREEFSLLTGETYHFVSEQSLIRSFNLFSFHFKNFKERQKVYYQKFKKMVLWQELGNPMIELAGVSFFCVVFYFGSMKIRSDEMSAGALMSFLTSAVLLVDPLKKFSRDLLRFKTWSITGEKIYGILELKEESSIVRTQAQNLKFDDFHLKIHEQDILKNINFEFKREKTAIIGNSGSGKSTLVKSILGLAGVDHKGSISFYEQKLDEIRNNIAYVSQAPYLFHKSVRDNIILNQSFNQKMFDFCVQVTCCDEFFDSLESGIQTIIGGQAGVLSRGQAQRVCLARAIYSQKEILILDEATSALDNELDQKVNENLLKLEGFKIINISHRVSSIQNYDEIMTLDQGEVIHN